jgi:hypothetical protein
MKPKGAATSGMAQFLVVRLMGACFKIHRPTVMRYLFIVVALLIACVATADPINALVIRLSSQPEWRYGIYPTIDLPQSATTNQVVEQIFKTTAFKTDAGIQSVKTFKILEICQVYIPASDAVPYTAVLVETDLGRKIAVFRLEPDQKKPYWWSRVYDAWEKDCHLVATQLRGAPASGKPAEFPVVYVLVFSSEDGFPNPLVYSKFNSEDMRLDIRCLIGHGIAPGSVLHFDTAQAMIRPPDEEIKSLTDYCKKLGISFDVTMTE